jgi:hypothetical protein
MEENKFSILATLGIILIAIAIGFSIFWRSDDTTSPTAEKPIPINSAVDTKPAANDANVYLNNDFGFTVSLPQNWKGYSLLTSKWTGVAANSPVSAPYAEGPIISIRSPLWTAEAPRQDIPVMVFTLAQWNDLQQDLFHIGAAPINPSELGRNANYVFALPARYNFAFLPGYEEVQQIIDAKSLHGF